MAQPTAIVTIAPYPVPVLDEVDMVDEGKVEEELVPDDIAECDIRSHYETRIGTPDAEQPEVMSTSVAELIEKLCPVKTEPDETVCKLPPPPAPLKRQGAFIDLTKTQSCCPLMMPTVNTPLPVQHMIIAFFAGALIGTALVMCFSDSGVVVAAE